MVISVKLFPRELKEVEFPEARILSSEEQARYDGEIQKYRKKAKSSLDVKSNLWRVLLLNQMGIRTATLPELECALENDMDLKGFYEDAPSVILRSAGDSHTPNDYIAKGLAKKLKIRSFKTPIIVNGLKIVEDNSSQYGLNFDTKNAELTKALDFNNKNHNRKFSRINPDYSIEFDNDGTRTLYTRDNGVSRLCLGGDSDLDSGDEGLAGSGDDGRVVVVTGEASSQKILDKYISDIKEESAKQIADIEQRTKKAKNYIRTGKLE